MERAKDMSDRLKHLISWTLYISVVLIALFTIVSLCINVLAPTCFPNADISGFKDYINTFCVILSFLSVGLGIYSILQAGESNKQANEVVNSIQALKQQQELLLVTLKSTNDLKIVSTNKANGNWSPDDVIK